MDPSPDELAKLRITDEDVVRAKPAVRAMLISRLEMMWNPIGQHLDDTKTSGFPPDARLLEIGLRIVKEEANYYGVDRQPVVKPEEPDDELPGEGIDRRALVNMRLEEIEERLRQAQGDQAS